MAVYLGLDTHGPLISADSYMLKDINDVLLVAIASSSQLKIILNNEVYRLNINSNLNLKEAE